MSGPLQPPRTAPEECSGQSGHGDADNENYYLSPVPQPKSRETLGATFDELQNKQRNTYTASHHDDTATELLTASMPGGSLSDPSRSAAMFEASASRSTLMSHELGLQSAKTKEAKPPKDLYSVAASQQPSASTLAEDKIAGGKPLKDGPSSQLGYFPRTPFGMNRYILFLITLFYTVCVGSHFFNWPSWEGVFQQNNVYGYICDGSTPMRSPVSTPTSEFCDARKKATDRLFLIVQACMFSFSFVAGMVLDVIGTKVCCIFGNVLLLLGWTSIAISSQRCELYPLAFALIGAGTDPAFFGTLSISNVFPENPSLIIALLGAARSVSNLWPKMLHHFAKKAPSVFTMPGIALFFVAMYLFCLILVIILVPSISYRIVARDPTVAREVTLINKIELATIGAAPAQAEVEAFDGQELAAAQLNPNATSDLRNIQGVVPVQTSTVPAVLGSPLRSAAISRQLSRVNEGYYQDEVRRRTAAGAYHLQHADVSSVSRKNSTHLKQSHNELMSGVVPDTADMIPDPENLAPPTRWERFLAALRHTLKELKVPFQMLRSPLYFPIVLFSIGNILRNGYYIVSAKDRLGPAQEWLVWMNLLGFLPGPFCGYLVNRYSPFVVMHGLNASMGIVFVLVLISPMISNTAVANGFLYASTLFALPFIGFLLSQVYCYIAIVFDPDDLGKLAGFASFVAGFCGLLTEPMTQLARRIGFAIMDIVNLIITVISFFLLCFVMWRLSVQNKKEDVAALIPQENVAPLSATV